MDQTNILDDYLSAVHFNPESISSVWLELENDGKSYLIPVNSPVELNGREMPLTELLRILVPDGVGTKRRFRVRLTGDFGPISFGRQRQCWVDRTEVFQEQET